MCTLYILQTIQFTEQQFTQADTLNVKTRGKRLLFFFFFLNILYFTSSQYYTIILSISFYFLNFLSDSSYLALFYRYRKFINFEFRILSPSRISEF